jgi:hypothetical protein
MILPEECAGYRFGVGHAEFGLMFFKPLSDSHLAQHFSMLGMVPTDVCYMTKVTSHNHGSPQIARVLRDREDQADMEGGQQSGTDACTPDRVKTVQELVGLYEKSVGLISVFETAGKSTVSSNLTVPFEQVSGEAQFGGAPPRNEPTVGGGGPEAISQTGSQPAVGTVAHSPTTHPFRTQPGPGVHSGTGRARWAHGEEGADGSLSTRAAHAHTRGSSAALQRAATSTEKPFFSRTKF